MKLSEKTSIKNRIKILQIRAEQLQAHIDNMVENHDMENESGKAMLEWMYKNLDSIYSEKAKLTRQI